MLELLLYTVASFGLAFVIGHSKISRPFRLLLGPTSDRQVVRHWLIMLLECPACLGFWFGLAYALATDFMFGFPLRGWGAILGLALYTCGANFLLAALSGLLWGDHDSES